MLSLEDVFSEKELKDWEDYLRRFAPHHFFAKSGEGVEYFCELKIDGFAITLIYENGIFTTGATRGNGRVGEDVTQNLKTIESIPLKLNIHPPPDTGGGLPKEIEVNLKKLIERGKIEVRGEVFMEKKAFEKLNKELEKKVKKPMPTREI